MMASLSWLDASPSLTNCTRALKPCPAELHPAHHTRSGGWGRFVHLLYQQSATVWAAWGDRENAGTIEEATKGVSGAEKGHEERRCRAAQKKHTPGGILLLMGKKGKRAGRWGPPLCYHQHICVFSNCLPQTPRTKHRACPLEHRPPT